MSRFIITTRRGEPAVTTDNRADAEAYQARLGGELIDTEASCVPSA